ncbi:MAG: hypothetical protein ABSH51_14460 [Solirubrobacteraceae bacterium]
MPFDAASRRQAVDRRHAESGEESGWAEIVAGEAARMLRAMLSNDPRPHFFHQSNLIGGEDGDDLLFDVVDAALAGYGALVAAAPVLQPTFRQIGDLLGPPAGCSGRAARRHDHHAHRRSWCPDRQLRYGGTRLGWVDVAPGETRVAVAAPGD